MMVIIVIMGDRFSRPAGTCILFGDGCGAVVLTAKEGDCSVLGMQMNSGARESYLQLLPFFVPIGFLYQKGLCNWVLVG